MTKDLSSPEDKALAKRLVKHFLLRKDLIERFHKQVLVGFGQSKLLNRHIHSLKDRIKDPDHLEKKILRQILKCRVKKQDYDVDEENLLTKITDLSGIRVLHLYTHQIGPIDEALREIIEEDQYELIEGPFARTWDDESRDVFEKLESV